MAKFGKKHKISRIVTRQRAEKEFDGPSSPPPKRIARINFVDPPPMDRSRTASKTKGTANHKSNHKNQLQKNNKANLRDGSPRNGRQTLRFAFVSDRLIRRDQ